MRTRLLGVAVGLLTSSVVVSQDWPAFRGPLGDGVSTSKTAPTTWGKNENIKWRIAMSRPANGSPIVSNGRVFVTQSEDAEGKKRSLYCFDRTNGERLWVRTVDLDKVMPTHNTNPYGGTTPVADGERVVVWHASAGLYCYDFKGNEIWHRDFGEFRHRWGYGSSPILHEGHVILNSGPGAQVFLVAVKLSNGATVWRMDEKLDGDGQDNAAKKYMGSWSTPVVTRVGEQAQCIVALPTRVVALAPASGELLWSCDGVRSKRGDLAYCSPIIADDVCFFTCGYGGPGLAIRLGGDGDVTKTHRLWRHPVHSQSIGSGVFVGGSVYTPDANGQLFCMDAATGKVRWKQRSARGALWGSIVSAAGRLYVLNQKGATVVFRANPEKLEVVAVNELGETANSTPAVSDGEIFIRTYRALYCIAEASNRTKAGRDPKKVR